MTSFPFFPNPAPGETVYSTFCRCAERSGLPERHLISELTGQQYRASIISPVPGYLGALSKRIPSCHSWCEPMNIVLGHTALPYIVYFYRKDEQLAMASELASKDVTHPLAMAMGLSRHITPPFPRSPRYCLKCIAEQQQRFGFTFFRREHQLPGVLVCFEHEEVLSHGCAECGPYPINRRGLSMPGRCCCDSITPLNVINSLPDIEPLVWIARESAFLLKTSGTNSVDVANAMRTAVIRKGYSRGSAISYRKLAEAIEARFSINNLQHLSINVWTGNQPSPWLQRLINSCSGEKKRASLLFLLVIGAIFESVEEFENFEPTQKIVAPIPPKASARWPNLKSMIDDNYSLPKIAKILGVRVENVIREMRRQKLQMNMPDNLKSKFGKTLECIRKDLLAGHKKSEIMKRYSCSEELLIYIELDQPSLIDIHQDARKSALRNKHRGLLIDFLSRNPDAGRNTICNELVRSYEYFHSSDKEWFYEKIPARNNTSVVTQRNTRFDWVLVDQQKSQELERIIGELTSIDKPFRLTKTGMLKRIGIESHYINDPNRFPLVESVIMRNLETREEYIDRKLCWAVERLKTMGKRLSLNTLRLVAGINVRVIQKRKQLICELADRFGVEIEPSSDLAEVDISGTIHEYERLSDPFARKSMSLPAPTGNKKRIRGAAHG